MKKVLTMKNYRVMKKSMKYICAFLMMVGISTNAWGTTTTEVIFPAGTTSSYTGGDWGDHGAYIGDYPTTEATETMCISDGVGFDVKFYYAYDGGDSNGLQLKKNSSAYVEITIASSNGITVEVTYSAAADFDIDLTGAKTVTASNDNTTASINTNNTNATLKINGTSNVVYIKYIKITRKSTGTITIGHDDCVVGANITFGATSVSKSVTPAEAESGGTFSTLRVDGVNIYDGDNDCDNWVAYDFENASGASGIYGTDWEFSVEAASSSEAWTCIDYGVGAFSNEALTISYSFLSEPEPGTYTADLIARTWDAEFNAYDFSIPVTITVTAACTSRSITMSDFSKDFGAADFVPEHTVSAGSGTKIWTSSNTDVATIVDGKVHIVSAGSTTIGLSVAADDPYCAVSKNCTMTVNALVPTVTAFTGTSTTPTSITLTNAQVSNKGGAAITEYGYIYSTTASTAGTLTKGASGVNAATVASADITASTNFAEKVLSELTENTHYYIRAYATNAAGTGYSDVKDVKTVTYTDYVFSCAALTLTGPTGDLIFITSAASKTVRSQEAFHVLGSGLTPNTTLTFAMSDPTIADKFAFKQADGSAVATNASGAIDMDFYVFYTPASGDTEDGLDRFTNLSASVSGTKPKTSNVLSEKTIIGRHLPADFVIAAKNTTTNKWFALPANMAAADNPIPSEIAVDDIDNPTIAYTANSNYYSLYGNDTKQYIQFGMTNNLNDASKPFALWANNSDASTKIGKSSGLAENSQGANYQWLLTQTNTSITNPQDAKYTISNPNNSNALKLWLAAEGGPKWGLYAYGVAELRLIPASDIVFAEAYFVEWAQHGGVVEVDAEGVDATSVVAHLGEATSEAITLVQTKAGDAKNAKSKYNYTVNFGVGVDFAAAASNGAMLTLEWKNGATVKAVSNIVVPKIIATSATMSSINPGDDPWLQMEVHVLPGVTLTANAGDFSSNDVVINQLEIYPGATVEVTKGEAASGTLKVKTLVLRNGWTRAGAKAYDVARLYITPSTASMAKNAVTDVWYSDWYIDYDQYYPIAVPWKVTLATGLQYRYTKVSPTYGYDKNIRLLYYDGEGRAKGTNGSAGDGANWRFYGAPGGKAMPATLDPSKAYAMTAKRPTGKAFSIIRMTMDVPSAEWTTSGEQGHVTVAAVTTHKDTVNVVAYNNDQGNAAEYAKGWNFIANPYMSLYQGQIGYTEGAETVRFVNIPDEKFKEYDQLLTTTAKLKPASGVLIQAPKTGRLIFGTDQRKLSMPSFYSEIQKEQMSEQQAVIVLSNETNEDMMGLLVADEFTEAYETNADLEKLLSDGNTLRTYMRYGDMNMAYVAINEMLAKEWIPVSVRIPADGEYTFSLHEASKVSELEGVYLIDYQNGDKVTNLIEQSYTFSSTAGTINGRFAINAKAGERQTPTGIDAINAGGDINSDKPFKFIYHDKVYIWLNGVIYDTTGKRVK